MEKRTPHCRLEKIRSLIGKGLIRATKSAHRNAELINFSLADMYRVVSELSPHDFYKSMTAYDDHRIWQDVYYCHLDTISLYLKLTVIDDVLIVSFKELDHAVS
ncbi:MAG: type II toxin-antitoxin system MqsR family toxin [Hafnia paralvei]|jgi:motility quorum-sensing regulator / GCU-specific mRNA interferase toxin|uniref:type II toxin-antitoxin system MqsR family toxin n=1 Tax=Hafnia paralvei TaxID=546367 RepID=UPI00158503FF|nr:type II toxin-antitoxin system MqsR family toxin [Hafnia paralvei]MCE9881769.1 type II toxin-antitoxin system MqsR family toxin [Hafnia paralvei]MCE9906611.1 type II toxin-antitoxin system MqsR family toxin [Hafnia paralvei]MCE9911592.1 type II toxin-antitoxin system MqsR family toxin [Hafnia paralvei]MDX6840457.1 type II toxin-antitoxin system MqsR family toxin [Hafnia paralvei]NUN43815.1 type II toxin-antitoxin system MqsR family toxin [Hafnia paralvei]